MHVYFQKHHLVHHICNQTSCLIEFSFIDISCKTKETFLEWLSVNVSNMSGSEPFNSWLSSHTRELSHKLSSEHVHESRRISSALRHLRSDVVSTHREIQLDGARHHLQERVQTLKSRLTRMRSASQVKLATLLAREEELDSLIIASDTHANLFGVGPQDPGATGRDETGIKVREELEEATSELKNNIGQATDDRGPPSERRKSGDRSAGWSQEDERVFLREVFRGTGGAKRHEVVRRVWEATSGAVRAVEDVEVRMMAWEREQERKRRVKEKVVVWRRRLEEEAEVEKKELALLQEGEKKEVKPVESEELRKEKREMVKKWREIEEMKLKLREADLVANEVKKKNEEVIKWRQNRFSLDLISANDQFWSSKNSRMLKKVENSAQRRVDEIERIFQSVHFRQRDQEYLEKVLQLRSEKKQAEKAIIIGPRSRSVERDPERLFRTTESQKRKCDRETGSGNSNSLLPVEMLQRRCVPEWRRSINLTTC